MEDSEVKVANLHFLKFNSGNLTNINLIQSIKYIYSLKILKLYNDVSSILSSRINYPEVT